MVQGKQNRAQFSNWLCYEASGLCKSKPPPLPKGRKPGPAFQAIDPKEAEMEKMLAGMKVAHTASIYICFYKHAVVQLLVKVSVKTTVQVHLCCMPQTGEALMRKDPRKSWHYPHMCWSMWHRRYADFYDSCGTCHTYPPHLHRPIKGFRAHDRLL